jgi:hypothetical protein
MRNALEVTTPTDREIVITPRLRRAPDAGLGRDVQARTAQALASRAARMGDDGL